MMDAEQKDTPLQPCQHCGKKILDNNMGYMIIKFVADYDGAVKRLLKSKSYHQWCWEELAGEDYVL